MLTKEGKIMWSIIRAVQVVNTKYCTIVFPLYQGGICSKITSGCLKLWIAQNPIYTLLSGVICNPGTVCICELKE